MARKMPISVNEEADGKSEDKALYLPLDTYLLRKDVNRADMPSEDGNDISIIRSAI
jgi:hypothetical protein